jgi:hypothetical protein
VFVVNEDALLLSVCFGFAQNTQTMRLLFCKATLALEEAGFHSNRYILIPIVLV